MQLRKNISRLERMKSGELNNTAVHKGLERRNYLNKKGLPVILEELKQRVLAKSQKIRRYQDRIEQYKHWMLMRVKHSGATSRINQRIITVVLIGLSKWSTECLRCKSSMT